MDGEFQEWELLHNPDSPSLISPRSDVSPGSPHDLGDDSQGLIRTDYFSINDNAIYASPDDASEDSGSLESDNPSWVDPESDTRYCGKHSSEFWSDSSSDRSDERKLCYFSSRDGLMCVHDIQVQGYESGREAEGPRFGRIHLQNLRNVGDARTPLVLEGSHDQDRGLAKYWSDSSGEGSASVGTQEDSQMRCGDVVEMEDCSGDSTCDSTKRTANNEKDKSSGLEAIAPTSAPPSEVGKKGAVWWKIPFELLNYYLFKVSPVWSFSVAAAAVMGFIIFGRRLYKMKKKSRSLQLNVKLDDKILNRATRLNEGFSVGRRVPIIRPAVPMPGMNTWPIMSLR